MSLSNYESTYAGLIQDVMHNGTPRKTRNGDTCSIFGKAFEVDQSTIPLLVGRRMHYKGVLGELAAFLRGPSRVKDFTVAGCNYWNDWADKDGYLRLDYGNLWSDFDGYDQIAALKKSLKEDPFSRRHIISGWNPANLDDLSAPCCHIMYQWYVTNDNKLEMIWTQRSVDVMIGLPSDVILATTWNHLLANELGFVPGRVIFMLGDCHIYDNNCAGASQYLDNVEILNQQARDRSPYVHLKLHKGLASEEFWPTMVTEECYNPMHVDKMELNV